MAEGCLSLIIIIFSLIIQRLLIYAKKRNQPNMVTCGIHTLIDIYQRMYPDGFLRLFVQYENDISYIACKKNKPGIVNGNDIRIMCFYIAR